MDTPDRVGQELLRLGLEEMRSRYDPEVGMLEHRTELGVYHESRQQAAACARCLLAAEGEAALAVAQVAPLTIEAESWPMQVLWNGSDVTAEPVPGS